MQQRLHGLICHPDVTRFEIEDALVRQAASELVSKETSILEIDIDLGLFRLEQSSGDPLGNINSLFLVTADDSTDADAEPLAELIAEAAVVSTSWPVEVENISELEKAWIGTATPGPKITVAFDSSAADSSSYRDNIVQTVRSVVAKLDDVGARSMFLDTDQDAPFSTAVSFWFPTPSAAQDALDGDALKSLTEAGNISSDSLGIYQGTEHRVFPNPNIWSTTTGLKAPESD